MKRIGVRIFKLSENLPFSRQGATIAPNRPVMKIFTRAFTVYTILVTLVLTGCFFYFYLHTTILQSIFYRINSSPPELLKALPFLRGDSRYGWSNKLNYDDTWPAIDSRAPKELIRRYTTSSSGERIGHHAYGSSQKRIWVFGDSSPFAFGVNYDQSFSQIISTGLGMSVQNFAVSGYGTTQILMRFNDALVNHKERPKLVIYWGGINDVLFASGFYEESLAGGSLRQWKTQNDVRAFVRLARDNQIPVAIVAPTTFERAPKLNHFSNWIKELSRSTDGLFAIDMEKLFRVKSGKELYATIDDLLPVEHHLHPSEKGHQVIAEAIILLMNKIDGAEGG